MPRAVSLSASDGSRSSISSSGGQPMTSSDGRYVLVFNGEVYNHAALRHELGGGRCLPGPMRHRGAPRGHPDLGTATRSSGSTACSPLRAGTRAIVCFTSADRFGEKPLYYGWLGRTFVFGSELKAVQAHPDIGPRLDRDPRRTLFFRQASVPAPHLRGDREARCRRLSASVDRGSLPGHLGRGVPGRPSTRRWRVAHAAQLAASSAAAGRRRRGSSRQRRQWMVADVPVGALLSGGLDSSLIVALMQAQGSGPVRTFTVGFDVPDYDEAPQVAAASPTILGTDHTELRVTPSEARRG